MIYKKAKWIYGDTHFGTKGMFNRTYSKTFETVEEHIEQSIARYNSLVRDEDVVIFLGDLGLKQAIEYVIPRLKGIKVLIVGNHDGYTDTYYSKLGFVEIYRHPIYFHPRLVLSHEPTPVEFGVVNAHGHTHFVFLDSPWHMNLCTEWTEYKPVLIEKILKKVFEKEKPNRDFLMEWYKDMQIWTGENEDGRLILDSNNKIQVKETLKKFNK